MVYDGPKWKKMVQNGGPNVPAWAPEGREGQLLEYPIPPLLVTKTMVISR